MLPLHQERAAGNPQPVVWLGRPLCLSVTAQAQLPGAPVPILLLLSSAPPCPGHHPCSPCQQPGPAGGGGAGRVWKFPSLWVDSTLFCPPSFSQPFQNNTFQFLPNILPHIRKKTPTASTLSLSHTHSATCPERAGPGHRSEHTHHPVLRAATPTPLWRLCCGPRLSARFTSLRMNEPSLRKFLSSPLEADLGWPNPPVYQACQGMVAPDGGH